MSRPPPLVSARLTDGEAGVTSVCTAHPLVIEAALLQAARSGRRALIEATCNQVNQEGGYTGMTPADFRAFVEAIAARVGFDSSRIIFGGDHLGPNPWKRLPADEAMGRAKTMIDAYARAGFAKLHLDTSMGCAGEGAALPDEITAGRAASLARVAEAAAGEGPAPIYVIGTEVPVPGGAQHALDSLEVTRPESALRTVEAHRQAFAALGLEKAFARAIGVVVQPGVEFSGDEVVAYQPEKARPLAAALAEIPDFVFEAHSTDYQPAAALEALVRDGFAILKVGPWLTFALREALYGLDLIAQDTRRRARGGEVAGGDGGADAAGAGKLARVLCGQRRRTACPSTLQLQRPHPLLLGASGGAGGRRSAVRQARRARHSSASRQPIPRRALSRGGRRRLGRAAKGARHRCGPTDPGAIRSGVPRRLSAFGLGPRLPGASVRPRRASALRMKVSDPSGRPINSERRGTRNAGPSASVSIRSAKRATRSRIGRTAAYFVKTGMSP